MEEDIRYIIALGRGIAVGTVFTTRELAETAAKNLRLKYYEVIPQRVTK